MADASSVEPGTAGSLIGRRELVSFLQGELTEGLAGRGRIVLLSGEPGIGKTRCAEELALHAGDLGVLVFWGRCYEQPGTPAFWPWVRILKELAAVHSDDELRALLGRHGKIIGGLVPDIGFRLGQEEQTNIEARGIDRRFILFDAIVTVFREAAAVNPILIVIDDLHWADPSSLALLEFLAKQVSDLRAVVVGAYRDVEVTRTSPLLATLGELSYTDQVKRERLGGLTVQETAELAGQIAGGGLPETVTEAIFQQTDGNPLFVKEVARVFADERKRTSGPRIVVDVPDGIREAIGRRLDRLPGSCNRLLQVAAVSGRDFSAPVVARVLKATLADILPDIDTAIQAGFIAEQADDPSEYRFCHAVIRETLYDELPTLDRIKHHQQFGQAMVEIHEQLPAAHIAQVSYHFCEAAPLGDYETAAKYSLAAAAEAERVFAIEEANRLYDDAILVLSSANAPQKTALATAYVRKGRMMTILSHFDKAVESFSRGAEIALELEMPELFTECITRTIRAASNESQQHRLPQLEHALRILPPNDLLNRSNVLAHLAFALRFAGDTDRILQAGQAAIDLARELGNPTAIAIALRLTTMGLRCRPTTLDRRIEYGREMITLTESMEDPEEVAECWYWHLLSLIEGGQISEFEALLRRYAKRSNRFGLDRHGYQARLLQIAFSLLRGEWHGVRERIEEAFEIGSRLSRRDNQQSGEGAYGAQMFLLNRELGSMGMLRPLVRQIVDNSAVKPWLPGFLIMCCEVGFDEEAAHTLNELARDSFGALPNDDMWLACVVFCAEACAYLDDSKRAKVLYQSLLPYAEQTVNHPAAVCFGPVSRYLGMLAATLGKDTEARKHYESAIQLSRDMGAWPSLARTQFDLGRLLLTHNDADQVREGRRCLLEAEQLAGRFKMTGLAEKIGSHQHGARSRWPDSLTDREVEVLRLIAIGRSNKDISKVLEISLSTVATHIRSIFGKTDTSNRTEAAAYAVRHELN